jgi:hypothetical protein
MMNLHFLQNATLSAPRSLDLQGAWYLARRYRCLSSLCDSSLRTHTTQHQHYPPWIVCLVATVQFLERRKVGRLHARGVLVQFFFAAQVLSSLLVVKHL